MDNQSKIIIVVFVIAIIGLGGVLYSQGYFEGITPQPQISIAESNINFSSRCTVVFYLVNSGDIDGFASVELRSKAFNNLINENRYFIKADTEERIVWGIDEILSPSCNKQNLVLSIFQIERG